LIQTVRRILTRKCVLIPLGMICLYSLIGFFIVPWGIGWYAPQFTAGRFHQQLELGMIRIDPFRLTLQADDVRLGSPEVPLIACRKLFIDFEIIRLCQGIATFRQIVLEKPTVHLTIHPDGITNLEKAIPISTAPESSNANPFLWMIENAQLSDGTIHITDQRHSRPANFTLQNIDLTLTDISTLPDRNGGYQISTRTSGGETFACLGKITPIPFSISGKLSFGNVRIETLWPFIGDYLDVESITGKLDISTDYLLNTAGSHPELKMNDFHFGAMDLSIKPPHADKAFFTLKQLDVDQVRFNLTEKNLRVGKVRMASGSVNLHIDETGRIDIARIVRTDPQKTTTDHDGSEEHVASSGSSSATSSSPWTAVIDSADIRDIAFGMDDFSRVKPVSMKISNIGMGFSATYQSGTSASNILLENFSSELKEADIHRSGDIRPIFETQHLSIDGGTLNLTGRTVTVSRIALQGGNVDIFRDTAGQINWQHLFAAGRAVPGTPEPAPADTPETAWNYRINSFEIVGLGVDISDIGTVPDRPVVNIESFSGKLSDVDGRSPMGFEAGFSLKQGGTVTVHGKVDPAIPSIDADIQFDTLSVMPLRPYIETYTSLTLQSADISFQGNVRYGMKTENASLSYTGSARLDKLNLTEANTTKTIIGWDSLQIPKCNLTLQPDQLNIEEILISKPTGELIIAPDRSLNLSNVFKPQGNATINPPPRLSSQPVQKAFPVRIGKIDIRKGDVLFADLSLEPQFMTRITDLEGLIGGLSSSGDSSSSVRLDGHVDPYGMARVDGKIDVFHPARSTDLSLVFKNVEMTKLTPYSGKFAGRRITSGKLSMDLRYRVQNYQLVGDNQIIVDNLTLGEHVDSPDAVNLPLDLAVALLKDSNGRIDIGLPVSGDLNDPKFNYGSLLWKAFTNLLSKMVTAPFRALGSLFGSRNELDDRVIFDPGETEILPPEKEKLVRLSQMLKNRPQLKLAIQGRFSEESDGAALKEKLVRRSVLDRTGKSTDRQNASLVGLDFTDPSIQAAVEHLFTEKAGRPTFDELKKSVTEHTSNKADIPHVLSETLYKKRVEMEPLPSHRLPLLAEDRGRQILQELKTICDIPAERLTLTHPESITSGPPSAGFTLEALSGSP